jgi:simple sugar transport system ATP-binding protein
MFDGVIVGEADPATATEGELGLMMAGIAARESPTRGADGERKDR